MNEIDRRALQEAKKLLENPSLAARLVNVVAGPSKRASSTCRTGFGIRSRP